MVHKSLNMEFLKKHFNFHLIRKIETILILLCDLYLAISKNKVVFSMKQFTKPGKELSLELPVECFVPYGNSSIPTLLPIGNHLL